MSTADPVTVIVPLLSAAEQGRGLLSSIAKHTTSVPHRVLVVDCGTQSTSEAEDLAIHEHVRVLRQANGRGFASAINLAVQQASTTHLCIVHDSLRVTQGWLERMLRHLDSHAHAGLVVPSLDVAKSAQRMDFGAVRTEADVAEAALHLCQRFQGQVEDVAFVESACVLMTRATFLEVGAFDEEFSLASHRDADFCRRARKLGLRLLVARDAVAYFPPGRAASDELNQVEIVRNRLLLKRRWMDDQFFRAVEAAARNDHATAIGLYEQLITQSPARIDALVKMAVSLHATNQPDAALHCVDRFLETCPRSKDGMFVKAQVLVGMSHSDAALSLLEEVERSFYVEPAERRELLHTIASLHRLLKRPERALEYLQRALDASGATPELYMTLIETAAETGQPSLFAGALECLVDADPKNLKLRLELGAALKVAGDVEGAKRAYRTAVKLDPSCEEARSQLDSLEASS